MLGRKFYAAFDSGGKPDTCGGDRVGVPCGECPAATYWAGSKCSGCTAWSAIGWILCIALIFAGALGNEGEGQNDRIGSLQDFVVNLPTWCPQFLSPALMFQISVDVAHLQCCSHSPTFPLVGIGCYRLPFCPWSFSEYTVYCILIFFISYP